MEIVILGNGGAINEGLPYNSFLIDGKILVETPPDIMPSLFRENVDLLKIDTVFISHYHADHYFGFPFLALHIYLKSDGKNKIKVIGPPEIKEKICEICRIGLGSVNPLQSWVEGGDFVELRPENNGIAVFAEEPLTLSYIPMYHSMETYGFTVAQERASVFSYLPDSVWHDNLLHYVGQGQRCIIVDMNGEPSDKVPVHISEKDIRDKALPASAADAIFYGTHLRRQKKSDHERIVYAKPGDVLKITCR